VSPNYLTIGASGVPGLLGHCHLSKQVQDRRLGGGGWTAGAAP
jgi:hypothetical protein